MRHLKKLSILAAFAALAAENGFKNLVLWSAVTVGAPATTAGFVYEIAQMRHATLQREAQDRASFTAHQADRYDAADVQDPQTSSDAEDDLEHQVSAALLVRSRFLDIHGGEIETMTPVDRTMALAMRVDDERLFAKLAEARREDPVGFPGRFKSDEARLRQMHAKMGALVAGAPGPMPVLDQPRAKPGSAVVN